jgi:hypothetical protein
MPVVRPVSAIAIALVLASARPAIPAPRCAARTGAWVALRAQGGPGVSAETPVVVIGKRIFVFGASRAIFDPCANRWSAMSRADLPDDAWSESCFSAPATTARSRSPPAA